jgi:hypothetical protein
VGVVFATGELSDMTQSLCETCAWMREVITPKASRFLLCELSKTNPAYPKYPAQPMIRCEGFRQKKAVTDEKEA